MKCWATALRQRTRSRRGSVERVALLAWTALLLASCGSGPEAGVESTSDDGTPTDLRPLVEELVPRLERLSGLDRVETLRVRRQSRADARAYIEQRLEQEMPADVREGVRRTYVALGLIPDTLDLDALLLDLYTEQVLGYYAPDARTLYVLEGADAESLRPVLAHELVHALQDQHTDLDSIVAPERGNDRQTAAHAAMEGHAMVVMFAVLAEQASGRTVDPAQLASPTRTLEPSLAEQNRQFPVFGRAPAIIQETLLFPYLKGADFVHQMWSAVQPQDRYPAPIDSLLPQSTEQVLRPVERFVRQRDLPTELRFDDDVAGTVVYENTLGQFETGILLEQHLGAGARDLANGWDGDRFILIDDAGSELLYWTSVWDSPESADAFADALRRVADGNGSRSIIVERVQVSGMPGVASTFAEDEAAAQRPGPTARVHTQ